MEPDDRARLGELMALMAEDRAFVFTFINEFGDQLARTVHWHLRELAREDVVHDHDEFEGLITDVALLIQDHAAAWKADGALPWTWAQRRIRVLISTQVGPRVVASADDLDCEVSDAFSASVVDLAAGEIGDLAPDHHEASLVIELVHEVASPRDAEVYLLYRQQRREGDPSPAETVRRALPQHALSSENVRKICQRVRVAVEPRFAQPRYRSIADLPFWAA